ncbi:uncharacterized protein LOC110032912 [Phalaenopsis equestris]|uniref:uncharacterized protein LOC110032912 n=1 Tax=Phalaenopsis equestris TaxID=78828 RepID=UPI0009E39D2F|nr:uncharacterized protein LOC110032912 [Phalaenopsis equestris]
MPSEVRVRSVEVLGHMSISLAAGQSANYDRRGIGVWRDCKLEEVQLDNKKQCRLFELLALCGMLIDHNWTEILKRRELYRDAFAKFDYNVVAKMEENDVMVIGSNKALNLAENRVRCIIDNAKCIQKVAKEFGSFGGYMWGQVNHKPMVNKYKYPKSIPLRTPKAEAISKDLVRRGFRLVGPVIVYSFMQAAGMSVDHIVDCFRFGECVRMAERAWGLTNMTA